MSKLTIGLLQANFVSAFDETNADIRKVAHIRSELTQEDFQHNHELLIELIKQAADKGAELVLSPESYLDGWSAKSDIIEKAATTIPGPRVNQLCQTAKESNVWICAGLFERLDDKIFNSAVLISSKGKIAGVYRKTHETKSVLEDMPYCLGDELPVFDTPWSKIGILICHDRWYAESARSLALQGASLILNPTAADVFMAGQDYFDIHRCVLRSQAYTNGVFWASCNSANHGGTSIVMDPKGSIVAEASAKQEVLITELKIDAIEKYGFLQNLRTNVYNYIMN